MLYYAVAQSIPHRDEWIRLIKHYHPRLYTNYIRLKLTRLSSHHQILWRLCRNNRRCREITALLISGLYTYKDVVIPYLQTNLNGFIFSKPIGRPTEAMMVALGEHGMCSGIQFLFTQHSLIVSDILTILIPCIKSSHTLRTPLMCLLHYLDTHPWLYHGNGSLFELRHRGITVFEYLIRHQELIAHDLLRRFPGRLTVRLEHFTAATDCYYTAVPFRKRVYFEIVHEISLILDQQDSQHETDADIVPS